MGKNYVEQGFLKSVGPGKSNDICTVTSGSPITRPPQFVHSQCTGFYIFPLGMGSEFTKKFLVPSIKTNYSVTIP